MKKPLIIFLIFSILTSNFVSFLIFVPKTKAIPVSIIASWPSELISKQLVHQAGQTFIEKVVVQLQKFILETLRKKLLDYFVDSIVRWIQGVDDKPAFVTNWRKFMGDVVNDAVGSYIETTKFAGLCDTFDFQVRVSLPQAGRPSLPTCTLNQIVNNIESFYGNFGNGSWLAFNETLYPQGNAYGSYIMALEGEVYEVLAAELEKEKETSQSTGGFLNTKRCIEEKIDVDTGEKTCLEWQTTTPGQTVAGRIQQALDVDIENVLSATEFTTYVAAIADAAINRLFKAGTDGLLGILTKEAPEKLGDGPTNINYECDTDLGACIMKVDGKFISKEECDIDCAEKSGVKWACEENIYACVVSPYGEYASKTACEEKCKPFDNSDWLYPSCDACKVGVYVRGRGTPGTTNAKGVCSSVNDAECNLCSAVTSGTAGGGGGLLCQTFCEATREEAWGGKTGESPKTFTHEEIVSSGYDLIWKIGNSLEKESVPDSCTCSYANNYKSLNEFSFGGGYTRDNSICYDCTKLPESAKNLSVWGEEAAEPRWVCDNSEWCDKYCCPTCPTPPPLETLQ